MLALARRALSRRSGSRWASASTRPTATPAECFVWGKGGDGALGLGDRKDCLLPEIVEFEGHDEDVCAFAAGESHSCVLDANRHLWAFGKADYGRLGTPQQSSGIVGMPTPVQVPLEGNDSVVGIDCGNYHTAAVSEQGRVYTWGWGGRWLTGCGGLGHGDLKSAESPKRVEALDGQRVVQVACGKYHTLARTDDGKVYAWGRGEYGRLGLNSNRDRTSPQLIEAIPGPVKLIATGSASSAAITESGRLYMWGKNDTGQLGLGGSSNLDMFALEGIPTLVEALKDETIADVSCSDRHTLACTTDGRVFIWGDRQWMLPYELKSAELGNDPVVQVAAGHNFSVILTAVGNVFTWGSGRTVCLGHGDRETLREPTLVGAFEGREVVSIAAGHHHVGALVKPNEGNDDSSAQ
ncbi:Regulator of chromosome condensation (RCC1) repeat [Plasmodiophora brassicae]|nr:hypothetical protein PBRA_007807 [Plasmodiophora brassicae]